MAAGARLRGHGLVRRLQRAWPWPGGFRRLRSKIIVTYAGLSAVLLICILGAVYLSVRGNAERAVRQELVASAVVYDRIWTLRTDQLEQAGALLAKDFGFRAALATGDASTIDSALANLSGRADVDAAFVIGPDGAAVSQVGFSAEAVAQLEAVAAAQDEGAGVFVVGDRAYLGAVVPVLAPLPTGQVVFASRLDAAELQDLARLSPIPLDARLLLKRPDGWTASGGLPRRDLDDAARLLADHGGKPRTSRVGDWITVVRPLHTLGDPPAGLLLRYSLSAALAPYRGLLTSLGVLALAGLALALGSAVYLAREVTRPVSRLRDATERFEKGEAVHVEVEGRDEIAALGRAFNRMTDQIEKRETALQAARVEAESANRAKSDFLANMSHEIRTPLNGILGMTQVMLQATDQPERRDQLHVVQESGEALLGILNSILDLSKIEAGRLELEMGDFDLEAALLASCAPFGRLAADKGVALRVEVDDTARGLCRGDALRVRQVAANLTSNAVKFTSAGEIVITACREGPTVAVSVRDTGPGIAPAQRDAIFERFAQADSSTIRRFGGTGLGLAICRELVGMMGGRLTLESELGQGSVFTFHLPLPPVEPAARQPELTHDVADPAEDEAADRPVRILAAEDNPTNARVLCALLEAVGAEIEVATDGALAVEAFRTGAYDIVLMDVQMPNMDGVEATRAIRRMEAEDHRGPVPIVAVTANVMEHQIADYRAAGMDDVVSKPIRAEALYEAINDLLSRAGERAAA